MHILVCAKPAHDFGKDRWNRAEVADPRARIVRPGKPRAFMRLPFRRHAIPHGFWRFWQDYGAFPVSFFKSAQNFSTFSFVILRAGISTNVPFFGRTD